MSQIKIKRFYYINSANLLTSSNNTFSVQLQIPDHINFNRVAVLQASIPISYYLVQYGLNTFTLMEGGNSAKISIPLGNYNINSFATVVSALLSSSSPNGLTYTMTYNSSFTQPVNGLLTYTANSTAHQISFIFDPNNSLNEQFGFDTGSTDMFTAGALTSTLISTDVCQFVPENTIYCHSNLVNSGYDDILQEFFNANNPSFSYIAWTNPDPLTYSKHLAAGKTQYVSFSFTNENELPIYFNGANVTLTLMLYRDVDYFEKAESFMRYQIHLEKERDLQQAAMIPPPPSEKEKNEQEALP